MKVPIRWLKEYVDPPSTPQELAKLLVMAGVGVESIEGDVLDLEITANRADLLSMLGVARETAVLTGKALRVPHATFPHNNQEIAGFCSVKVEARDLCPRYTARGVTGVRVGPSPAWVVERLEAAGIRPVNNVVDVTNYVLLETGQPLHAFDAKLLKGRKIVVRRAAPGEKLLAIDGKEYTLTKETLVIADAERPVAIAGVMGGKGTEITGATTEVLVESAQFDPVSVRRTSRRLGLSSDSSYRFERGVDFDMVDEASLRAVQLILEWAGGQAFSGALDDRIHPEARPVASVRPERVEKVLGMKVRPARIREILSGLGCEVAGSDETLRVTSPMKRRDLRVEVDYIEEVARIEGYDKIPCDTSFGLRVAVDNKEDLVREEARATLTGLGCWETVTWSFGEATRTGKVPYWTDQPLIPLRDPQGVVYKTLRESLVPPLLEVLKTNEGYKEELRPIFEIARVYRREGKGYGEKTVLGLAVPGDPLGVKGMVETLFRRLGLAFGIDSKALAFLEPGTAAEIKANGTVVGYLGQAGASLVELRAIVSVAELDFEELVKAAKLLSPYKDFVRQPPVERDLSIVLKDGVAWAQVEAAVRAAAPATLESIRFLSEYRGKGIEAGHKGWAFSMVFRAADRTLAGPEIDAAVQAILKALEGGLGGRLR
jgi:phenylalanyl-tRNA synthetase beta chain